MNRYLTFSVVISYSSCVARSAKGFPGDTPEEKSQSSLRVDKNGHRTI
jgi:hypothetical protein